MNIEKIRNYKLLYVEDEDVVKEATIPFLSKFFNDIVVANNGQDGFEKFQKNDFDLVITDMVMPKMSGAKLVEKIKENNPSTTTIIYSAASPEEIKVEKYCDIYLQKPIIFEKFMAVLEQLDSIIEKNKKHI